MEGIKTKGKIRMAACAAIILSAMMGEPLLSTSSRQAEGRRDVAGVVAAESTGDGMGTTSPYGAVMDKMDVGLVYHARRQSMPPKADMDVTEGHSTHVPFGKYVAEPARPTLIRDHAGSDIYVTGGIAAIELGLGRGLGGDSYVMSDMPVIDTADICTEPETAETYVAAVTDYDPYDIELLAKTLWGEAPCCPPDEQRLVAWTVFQRVDNPGWWGDSIRTVVTMKGQFIGYKKGHPVDEGMYALCLEEYIKWMNGEEPPLLPPYANSLPYYYFSAGRGSDGRSHNFFREGLKK